MDLQSQNNQATTKKEVRPGVFALLCWLSLMLTLPSVYWSSIWQATLHYTAIPLPFESTVVAVSAVLVAVTCASVLTGPVLAELTERRPGNHTLQALAIVASYVFALVVQIFQWASLGLEGQNFWWQASSLVVAVMFGRWLVLRVEQRAESPYPKLLAALPDRVKVCNDDATSDVDYSDLKPGDVIVVASGELIPVDGVVVHGEALIEEAFLDGPSARSSKSEGDFVFAGSMFKSTKGQSSELTIHDLLAQSDSADNGLRIRVKAVGQETLLGQLVKITAAAESSESPLQKLTRKTSYWIFFLTAIGSSVTGLCWAFLGNAPIAFAIERSVAVLALGSPALFLTAVPAVSRFAIANAIRHGVLVRSRAAFDQLPSSQLLLIDKTGILTTGVRSFAEAHITRRGGLEDVDELLAVAGGLEFGLPHGVAKAILAETYSRGIIPIGVKDVMNIPGVGISGRWEEHRLSIGGPVLLTRQKIEIDVLDLYRVDALNTAGKTVVFVARDAILLGYIALNDEVATTSEDVVWALQRLGHRVGLITGDAHGVAKNVADQLNIDQVYAEVLPADKAATVESLQEKGQLVALAGDAFADEPALEKADVSIAVAAPDDFSTAVADLVLLGSDATPIAVVAQVAKQAQLKTRANLLWAAGFNLVGLILAAGILATIGTVFVPAICAVLSSVALLIIWLNARSLEGKA